MITRDVYLPLEPVLVYGSLGVHVTSALLKRLLIASRSSSRIWIPRTSHILTGYALIALVLPHLASHRIFPSDPSPPINSLSPSELGFDYVAWGLYVRPFTSALAYLAIVGTGVWHASVGSMKIVSWIRRTAAKRRIEAVKGPETSVPTEQKASVSLSRRVSGKGLLAGLLVIVSIGLARLHSEGRSVAGPIVRRYEAVFNSLPWIMRVL
jgi:hypothetical protein